MEVTGNTLSDIFVGFLSLGGAREKRDLLEMKRLHPSWQHFTQRKSMNVT